MSLRVKTKIVMIRYRGSGLQINIGSVYDCALHARSL